jgi:hypothetical protein
VFASCRVATDFYLARIVHIVYGARPASYTLGAEILPLGQSGRSVMLTTHLQAQWLITSGAVSRLSQYAMFACKGQLDLRHFAITNKNMSETNFVCGGTT